MASSLDTAALHRLIDSGETVIVPQGHAAKVLRARLGAASAAVPPLAWHEWTATLWSNLILEGVEDRLLLNRVQEERLWSAVIADHPPSSGLTASAVRDFATLARSALQVAAAHCITDRVRGAADTLDTRTFAQWLDLFGDRCRRDRLLAAGSLDGALLPHIQARSLRLPPTLHFVAFEQITPSQGQLLDALTTAGIDIQLHTLVASDHSPAPRLYRELGDSREELQFAVNLIADQARRISAVPRIALVCPDPEEHRAELERLFREQLAPEFEAVTADLSSTPWYFATQQPLSSLPAIADALDLLRWTVSALPLERVGQLLISAALSFSDAPEARARFNVRSTQHAPSLRGAMTLAEFSRLPRLQTGASETHASFAELRKLSTTAAAVPVRSLRSPAEWAEHARKLLNVVGWPGDGKPSPTSFRTVEAWEGLLDLLATLQFDGSVLPFARFLDLLSAEADNVPAPAVQTDVPLQVLTLAQAEALTFDLAIHIEATDDHLPGVERRHPLLPQSLQRSVGIGDPGRTLAHARDAVESLAQRSRAVVLLAARGGPEGEGKLTALAGELGFQPFAAEALPTVHVASLPAQTEAFADPPEIPLATTEQVRGGVDVLRLQAACGFHAFATYRLGADEDGPRTLGIDAREGGSLLHGTLELIWQEIKDQATLRDLTREQRREIVAGSLTKARQRRGLRVPADDPWAARYLQVVERRFINLLLRWLEVELKRAPFTVLAQEQKQTLSVGPITLSLRPDRIDEVAGGQVFVDYKSSYALSSSHWLGERPDAPQLPAYALGANPETLKGIAFAQVRPGEKTLRWISLSEPGGPFPKNRKPELDLRSQIEAWREELTVLAEAFAMGDARVNPKSYPQTCQYCAHRILCRLDPATLLEQAEEDEDEFREEDVLG